MGEINKSAARKYLNSIGGKTTRVEDEKARRERALDVMLGVLKEENGDSLGAQQKRLGSRFPFGGTAEDADYSHLNLDKHDKRFHGGRFDEKTMTCKLRDDLAKADNPDAALTEHEEKMAGLSGKKVEEYARLLGKKRKDLDPEDTLLKIAAIKDQKLQGDAFRWLLKGAVRLPEDLSKVREAREHASRAKKDPFSYETPQACVNDLAAFKPKEKAIDPDTVPELSDKKVLPMGVTTYLVQDDQKGQAAMRRIIDTHWGEDANPWCLLARDKDEDREDEDANDRFTNWWYSLSADEKNKYGETDIFTAENEDDDEMSLLSGGEPERAAMKAQEYYFANVDHCYDANDASMRNAWSYWNRYNALPKRVAFKDGKLLAFMATDDTRHYDVESGHDFPTSEDFPELFKYFSAAAEEDEDLFFDEWLEENYPDEYHAFYDKNNKAKEQWWDRNDDDHEGIPVGNLPVKDDPCGRWADYEIRDGQVKQVAGFRKGQPGGANFVEWYENGKKSNERSTGDGGQSEMMWNEDGSPMSYESSKKGDYFTHISFDQSKKPDDPDFIKFASLKDGRMLTRKDLVNKDDPVVAKAIAEAEKIYRENDQRKGTNKMNLREVADAAIRESELVDEVSTFDEMVESLRLEFKPKEKTRENEFGEKEEILKPEDYVYHVVSDCARDVQLNPYKDDPKVDRCLIQDIRSVQNRDHFIATVYGGANGSGNFEDYLMVIRKFAHLLSERLKTRVWLVDWKNDCLDDVWTLRIGFEDGVNKDADATDGGIEGVVTEDAAKQLDKLKQLCRMGKISKQEFKTGLAGLYAAGLITMNQFDVAKRQFR